MPKYIDNGVKTNTAFRPRDFSQWETYSDSDNTPKQNARENLALALNEFFNSAAAIALLTPKGVGKIILYPEEGFLPDREFELTIDLEKVITLSADPKFNDKEETELWVQFLRKLAAKLEKRVQKQDRNRS
jgi:hypothetical protein